MKTGQTVIPNIKDIKGGNKEHYFYHYKEAIKRLGPDVRLWDTEHSEKLHQPAVKEAHRRSSKRFDGKQMSMALKYKEVEIIKKYQKMVQGMQMNKSEESIEVDVRVFEAEDTFSSNAIIYDANKKIWTVSPQDQLLHFNPSLTQHKLHEFINRLQQEYSIRYSGTFEFHLMEKLKVKEPKGTDDWMLRCTQHHNRNYHMEGDGMADYISICNGVSCNIENYLGEMETRICMVMAIVYMEILLEDAEHNIAATFVIVAPMEDSGLELQIPYDHLMLCKDETNEVIMECLNAKQRIVEPVFISTIIPFPKGDFDTDFYEIPFDVLNFLVIPQDRMSFPSESLMSPFDYMILSPKIFVSHEFLESEQTRLLLDYDQPDLIFDQNADIVDMIDSDTESVASDDFAI